MRCLEAGLLARCVAQLTMEKEALENKLEAEQEYIVNRLQKQVGHGAWRMGQRQQRPTVRAFTSLRRCRPTCSAAACCCILA